MTIVFPVAVEDRLVGSAVIVSQIKNQIIFATALHLFGAGARIKIALPPHQGNCNLVQTYPLAQTRALEASIITVDPFADLAILTAESPGTQIAPPAIAVVPGLTPVGADVIMLGYPFAPLGSFLETWTPCTVTALARRRIAERVEVDEMVLSAQTHVGSSGSAVVGKNDGILYGIVRGALAPPETLRVGKIPIGTDSSVTFATSAHILHDMLSTARSSIDG